MAAGAADDGQVTTRKRTRAGVSGCLEWFVHRVSRFNSIHQISPAPSEAHDEFPNRFL